GPGGVAKSRAAHGSVIRISGMIRRSVKAEIVQRDRTSERDAEGLDRAIEILVIERIFIMPDARGWIGDLVGNVGPAIHARLGFDRIDGRSGPGMNGAEHAHRVSHFNKGETGRAANIVTTIGSVVVHV